MQTNIRNAGQFVARCMLVLAAAATTASVVRAHHGWGGYVERVEGQFTITELKLGNPHDRLVAEDVDGQQWMLLLAPPARNRRFGFDEDTISVGDTVDILAQKHPKRFELKVHCISRDGENIYTYRYNGGRSSLERSRSEDRC